MASSQTLKPVSILGHPRSGTNFLTHVIRTDERTSCMIEPFSLHSRYASENESRYWGAKDYDSHFYHKDLASLPGTQKYFSDFRKWAYTETGDIRLFKETTFLLQMEWLSLYLPGLKVIYLERNPQAVVESFKTNNLFEKWGYEKKYQVLAQELAKPELSAYSKLPRPEQPSWISQLLFLWYVKTTEAKRKLNLFEHMTISYDDLSRKPLESFERAFAFMGLDLRASVRHEIDERTSKSRGGFHSTFRSREEMESRGTSLTESEMAEVSRALRSIKKFGEIHARE